VFLPTGTAFGVHEHTLRLAFRDLSAACADALKRNRRLIGADQKAYHDQLERNYVRFTQQLTPMVGGRCG
jgi:hypothetical protein